MIQECEGAVVVIGDEIPATSPARFVSLVGRQWLWRSETESRQPNPGV